tara:strand:- start:1771 stop:2640 length:870 start_codon:yes stop_codon:yes gene_type:complete
MTTEQMTTEQMTTEQPTKVAKKPTLSAKYSKFMVYGYWLANQLLSSNHIDDNTYNAILKHQLMFGDVEGQTEYFENFFEEQKASAKTMKQDIRKHNKPPKAKKEKVSDPDAPKAKRGRKKKVVEDSSTPEEKMVQEIIDAAEAMTIGEADPEKMEIVETAPEPVVETTEVPKKKRKSKKSDVTNDESVSTEVAAPKKKAEPKKPRKKAKEPEQAPPTPPLNIQEESPVMKEELQEDPIDDDDDEIELDAHMQDGVTYGIDPNDNTAYLPDGTQVGYFNKETSLIEFAPQ